MNNKSLEKNVKILKEINVVPNGCYDYELDADIKEVIGTIEELDTAMAEAGLPTKGRLSNLIRKASGTEPGITYDPEGKRFTVYLTQHQAEKLVSYLALTFKGKKTTKKGYHHYPGAK